MYDIIIIGSGPAGLTAGIYASRANFKVLLLAGSKWGGQLMLTTAVENYPGFPEGVQGPELMDLMRKQTARFGTEIVDKDVTWVDFKNEIKVVGSLPWAGEAEGTKEESQETGEGRYEGRAVIIATGADTLWLGLPNEQRLIGHGVSSCAPCDAFFFKDKKVVVVGGGDSAMEEALVLAKFASEITIVHRKDSFKASKIMQDRVLSNPKIKVAWNKQVIDVLGEEKVTGVILKSTMNDEQQAINCDGVFVAIGHQPVSNIFKDQLVLDAKGYVVRGLQPGEMLHPGHTHEELSHEATMAGTHHPYLMSTSVPGVFVAGDVHDHHYKQAVTAGAFGCMAAIEAEKWLEEQVA